MSSDLRDSLQHNLMVAALARWLENEGYFVKADHIDHPSGAPKDLNGRRPDVYATKPGAVVIGEAEVGERLNDGHTEQQWKAFSQTALGTQFHVIVPDAYLEDAKRQAAAWGVTVHRWHSDTLTTVLGIDEASLSTK